MEKKSSSQIGIRGKLILIFILIKVIPLLILGFFAAKQINGLGETVKTEYSSMNSETRELVKQIGDLASKNSINALDVKSRDAIERLTSDTAQAVASFLYQRDNDISLATQLPLDRKTFVDFLENRKRDIVVHRDWTLTAAKDGWQPATAGNTIMQPVIKPIAADNKKDFHYRELNRKGTSKKIPLYLEMTFIDLEGKEKIKVTSSNALSSDLRDVSDKSNTWCKAETYFSELPQLKDHEIYVSEVIGAYLPSPIIGPYTPERAKQKGIAFEPEKAGYAGKENPVGKRFEGIIRWAMPVVKQGQRIGYLTLALDHTHVMEFTDHIVPTQERHSPISDASSGNYAFMWDYQGKNISHARDYFIVGYDPETGEPAVPWLSDELYRMWQDSGLSYGDFQKIAPKFKRQSLSQKPSAELTKNGQLALDCRFLNFAPQCTGWFNLTQYGGSGSFVIFWSKLWKLTTAAAIPYYTGRYKNSSRGFGFVTIGANVHEFHSAANDTAKQINSLKIEYEENLEQKALQTHSKISELLKTTIEKLTLSTILMSVLVMMIAVWMASTLTRKILEMIKGVRHFQRGNLEYRHSVKTEDEMGQLAKALNEMSDKIQNSMHQLNVARQKAEDSDKTKGIFLANMSHEIRTPINAIIGMNRLALRSTESEKQRYLLETVKDSADTLLLLINDILDFSKVEAGQLDIEKHLIDLHDLIKSTVQTVNVVAEQKNLSLFLAMDPVVPNFARGDGTRLRQIFLNILNNAVKFTDKGSVHVEVNSLLLTETTMQLEVTIKDSGIGIPEDMKDHVFNSFSQVDSGMSRQYQGSGLGLAITRKLCQLMGGDVDVDCTAGQGCTFVFTVILERVDAADLLLEKGLDASAESLSSHILLVEDNLANRDLARMILEGEGYTVVEAENGLQALSVLKHESVDIILMDIQMPTMDGLITTKIIRSLEKNGELEEKLDTETEQQLRKMLSGKHHPIIALTAHAMSGDKEKCIQAGVDTYLTKPFIPEEIIAVLNEARRRE